ncbi:hypothetical protein [Rhodoferax fermentans]|uniref:hypothetical protein n=1 Tax=Rhodoferax fermentans TaxID=28066 RepID=UPI001301C118|nr:hypothetical protein [Rhodoferax fermentans]
MVDVSTSDGIKTRRIAAGVVEPTPTGAAIEEFIASASCCESGVIRLSDNPVDSTTGQSKTADAPIFSLD